MKSNQFLLYIVLALGASHVSSAPCATSVTIAARASEGSSWDEDGVAHQIWDITVKNIGTCSVTTLYAFFGYPATAAISSTWNYDAHSGQISSFGPSLAPNVSFSGAGFILAGSGTPSLAFNRPTCPCTTVNSTSAPAPPVTKTPAPTPVPDKCNNTCKSSEICANLDGSDRCHPRSCADLSCKTNEVCINDGGIARCENVRTRNTRTRSTPDACQGQCRAWEICAALESPTPSCHPRSCENLTCLIGETCIGDGGIARCEQTPSEDPTSAPITDPCKSGASLSVTIAARSGSYAVINGAPQLIYDITITTLANVAVESLVIVLLPTYNSTIVNSWNIAPVPSTAYEYSVTTFGALSGEGKHFTGAGIIVSGSSAVVSPGIGLAYFSCSAARVFQRNDDIPIEYRFV